MTPRRSAFPAAALALALACAAVPLSSGCETKSKASGVDNAFLTAPLVTVTAQDPQTNLLPLTSGDRWQMRTATRGKRFADTISVKGPAKVGRTTATELTITRDGKPWRREFYVPAADAVVLAAMQDETSPLMVIDPPVPLARTPLAEGSSASWEGTVAIKGVVLPARAYSRVSAWEQVTTSAGQFKAYRIDTVLTMQSNGRDIRFPSVRWLAPNIGFVRRGFADKGQPAFSELTQFNVR